MHVAAGRSCYFCGLLRPRTRYGQTVFTSRFAAILDRPRVFAPDSNGSCLTRTNDLARYHVNDSKDSKDCLPCYTSLHLGRVTVSLCRSVLALHAGFLLQLDAIRALVESRPPSSYAFTRSGRRCVDIHYPESTLSAAFEFHGCAVSFHLNRQPVARVHGCL